MHDLELLDDESGIQTQSRIQATGRPAPENPDSECLQTLPPFKDLGTGATSTVDEVYDARYPDQLLAEKTILQ